MKNKLKIFLMLLCVAAILVAVPACNKNNKNPDGTTPPTEDTTTNPNGDKLVVTLSETEMVIGIGETKKLSARSSITGMETSGVLWISDNPAVATVDTSGNVKGIAEGTAKITVSTIDGTSSAECFVTVSSKISGINIKETNITLNVNSVIELEYNLIPESITGVDVIWSSNNEEVVTVSENGVITAVANGSATVTAMVGDGKYDNCIVNVITPVEKITFTNTTVWNINKGVDIKLNYTITPSNASDQVVTWSSSDELVAVVSSEGKVTGVGAGSAVITATTSNGRYAQCTVNVTAGVSNVFMSHQEIRIVVGDEWQLTATIIPEDASNKKVTWTSSDKSIATVSASGIVTARKSSLTPVVITVRTEDGSHTAECMVWVTNPLKTITFDKTELNLSIFDDSVTIVPTYDPIDADDIAKVTWSSNNTKVATVDANGVVTPVGDGTAIITLSTVDGVHATCTVTVASQTKPVSSISVQTGYVVLKPGMNYTPIVTVLPEDASDKTYTVKSSDSSIVKVNADGTLTAVSTGTIYVTVTSVQDPTVSVEFFVKVEEMTQDEINSSIAKYNDALAKENDRHVAALGQIDLKYSYLTDLKKDMDSYVAQKAEIEKNLAAYRVALSDAENANNADLIKQYTDLITQEQNKLTKLESDYVNYPDMLKMYNEKSVEYKAEIDAENKLNADNIAKIKSDYAYITPYLPAT